MTRRELIRYIWEALRKVGIPSASFEANELGCFVLGCTKAELLADGNELVSATQETKANRLLQKRVSGYPLQYLLGEWEFYGRKFYVGEGVLIPRADTETICAEVIRQIGNRPAAVLDLCSGSGCIAITIAKECPNCKVYAIEKSEQAFSYLSKNIAYHGGSVEVFLGDALEPTAFEGFPPFDVIVSNPPYLTQTDMSELQVEVGFEPRLALEGGEDGLFFYRSLTALWKNRLKDGGRLYYELGEGQEKAVSDILIQNGFQAICETRDLCGIIRVISGSISK